MHSTMMIRWNESPDGKATTSVCAEGKRLALVEQKREM
jgi:hypothetical protein